MKTSIPPKIGWEILIPLNLFLLGSFYQAFMLPEKTAPLLVLGFTLICINAIFFTITYSIDSTDFYIQNSVFGTTQIKIKDIQKIEKTSSILSAPAPSIFGRIEIFYSGGSIVISPKNYDDFVSKLIKISPKIEVQS